MRKRCIRLTSFIVLSTTLASCASPIYKPDSQATTGVRIAATPNAPPQSTITNFTQSLRCMDEKLAQYEVSGLLIGAQEVPDAYNEVSGTKDMLLTALSTMSRSSKAFGIVALSQDLADVSNYHSLHGSQAFRAPDFFIRLSTPQIDKGVQTDQLGGGLGVPGAGEVQRTQDRIASVVSLDMNLGMVKNLQLLPGIYSSNSIAVVREGKATDVSGEIKKLGALFRITNDNSEGFHHSVRTLIELGAIEIVGRLTQIPYWECLDIKSTNPAVQAQVQDWFTGLSAQERVLFTQSKLSALKIYTGSVDGLSSESLRTAIATYKSNQGLIADGEIDFLLYYNLIIDSTPVAPQHLALLRRENSSDSALETENPSQLQTSTNSSATDLQANQQQSDEGIVLDGQRLVPLDMKITTNEGQAYSAGQAVDLAIVVSVDAYVFCYYQQGDGKVLKIFPNRFRPNSLVSANEKLTIPGEDRFLIVADSVNQQETVMCLASYNDIDKKLPVELRERDLQPLPVKDLNQVHGFYRAVATTLPLRQTIAINATQ